MFKKTDCGDATDDYLKDGPGRRSPLVIIIIS